jgi:hypothetical protein
MFIVAIINLIAVFFAYLARNKAGDHFLKISFFVIFYFLALRYNYGNDYSAYMDGFNEINSNPGISYFGKDSHFEPGWIFLCRLFKPFGFFILIAFLSMFNSIIYYRFLRKYVPPSYYWFAVFFYTFNPSLMLVNQSGIRQSIAIAFFLISLEYVYKKNIIGFLSCIAIASLFHSSALIVLPVYLIGLFNFKFNIFAAAIVFAVYLCFFRITDIIMSSLSVFLLLNIKDYAIYMDQTESSAGLGVLFYSIVLFFILIYAKNNCNENLLLSKISIFHFIFIPLGLSVTMFYRLGFYFTPALMAALPQLFLNVRPLFVKRSIIILLVLHTIYSYNQFMNSETYSKAFSTYKTILSQ